MKNFPHCLVVEVCVVVVTAVVVVIMVIFVIGFADARPQLG